MYARVWTGTTAPGSASAAWLPVLVAVNLVLLQPAALCALQQLPVPVGVQGTTSSTGTAAVASLRTTQTAAPAVQFSCAGACDSPRAAKSGGGNALMGGHMYPGVTAAHDLDAYRWFLRRRAPLAKLWRASRSGRGRAPARAYAQSAVTSAQISQQRCLAS